MYNRLQIQPEFFSMPIGNKFESNIESFHPGFRTIEQFETVRRIVSGKDFLFCIGPEQMFTPDSSNYKGPFLFSYRDTENKTRNLWILADGTYTEESR